MPELAEIHRFNNTINSISQSVILKVESKHPKYNLSYNEPVHIRSEVRGKELALFINTKLVEKRYLVNHGLVGKWILSKTTDVPPFAHVQFFTSDNRVLSYVDAQKMGKIQELATWGKNRGPDPILDHIEFCTNIISNCHKSTFSQQICEIMLDQDYFNGIGNYLRAEILYRSAVDPFQSARELFKNLVSDKSILAEYAKSRSVNENSDKGLVVLYMCYAIPQEVIEKGINKYGNKEEVKQFESWLQVYGKEEFKTISSRKFYYSSSRLKQPLLPTLTNNSFKNINNDASDVTEPAVILKKQKPNPNPIPTPSFRLVENNTNHPLNVSFQYDDKKSKASPSTSKMTTSNDVIVVNPEEKLKDFEKLMDTLKNYGNYTYFKPLEYDSVSPFAKITDHSWKTTKLLFVLNTLCEKSVLTKKDKDILKLAVIANDNVLFNSIGELETTLEVDAFVLTCKKVIDSVSDYLSTENGLQKYIIANELSVAPKSTSSFLSVPKDKSKTQSPTKKSTTNTSTASSSSIFSTGVTNTTSDYPGSTSTNIPEGLKDVGWINALKDEFNKPYFKNIMEFVALKRREGKVYPPQNEVFEAFNLTPLNQVKAVIIGQDPYFNEDQAHGLCFSVRKGVKIPPSLSRIYNVLEKTIPGWKRPNHGCLEEWAKQGVLLLNAT
eukprot:TRINITY_DN4779_c0_g1_i1.p1 TRINITY_DN4779_c0_g1~~TRINITY_DN4779_c0_g1_i1.p1  ORF type:complete len:666 (+),score=93.69 TRINITY_DN4779_c0_g1_i1:21-2018(+)